MSMRRAALLSILFVACFVNCASARVWYVLPDGTGQAPHIQAGIDSCAAGDTVVAMPGIFTGDGNWDIDFKGKPIVVMAARIFDPAITDESIIDGQDWDTPRCFYFHSNEDSTSVLSGFVIQDFHWAGIACDHSSPTILGNRVVRIDCIDSSPKIIGNFISVQGCQEYALICDGGSPYVANNRIFACDPGRYGGHSWSFSNCTSLQIRDNLMGGGGINNCTGVIDGNDIQGDWFVPGLDIDGSTLTITNNEIKSYSRTSGIYCHGSAVIIANNRIPGGLIMQESLPSRVMSNDIVGGEDMGHYGAIRYDGDSATVVEGNIIHDSFDGPGIECYSSIRIARNVIYGNGYQGPWNGGGIYCEASPLIEGNTIVGNMANEGAGVYCAPGSSAILRNNIITNKYSYYYYETGEGIHSDSPSITVECCDVFGNEGGNYVGIPDQTGINGNISQDPLFCDSQHKDFSLHASSPCLLGNHPSGSSCGLIGALGRGCGLAAPRGLAGRPIYCNNSVVGLLITWNRNIEPNISHYEIYRDDIEDFVPEMGNLFALRGDTILIDDEWRWFPHRYYKVAAVDSNGGRSGFAAVPLQDLTGTEGSGAPKATYLSQNYPNPFNPITRVAFGLSAPAYVSLRIYDASGRLVRVLLSDGRRAGNYEESWNGRDSNGRSAASGIYFYRLDVGSFTKTKKMVLLR